MLPKSTLPLASLVAVVFWGMGAAASSDVTVKVNLPSMLAGVKPSPAFKILTPERPTSIGSPVEYAFSNTRPSPVLAVAANVPSPLSTTATVNGIG